VGTATCVLESNDMSDTLPNTNSITPPAFTEDLLAWREKRVFSLSHPFGWWAITSLDWLEAGFNEVGSAPDATVSLAARFPAAVATLFVDGDNLTISPAPGADLMGEAGALTEPLVVQSDTAFTVRASTPARVNIVRRSDLWGVRVYDPVAASTKSVQDDVAWFAPAPEWVLEAEFIEPESDETVPVSNVIGQVSMQRVAGRVRFQHDGATHTLLATDAGGGRLFINFRDASNEDYDRPQADPVTYSGGRFLTTDVPVNGRVTLDFNRAYHPPCAHTPYATCPIPTRDNKLPFRVEAGERVAGG